MTVGELIKVINGKLLSGNLTQTFNNISIDSRTIKENDLFLALKGKRDGNDYIDEAILKGCRVVITESDVKKDITVIKVKNCYEVLALLGSFVKNKYNIPLIAVTGSVGKTLTKDLIADILSKKYCVLKSKKNFNNHLGVPLTLLKLKPQHQLIVCEFGMNHLKEISFLSKICRPDVGIITKIASSHIGNLGSLKNILKAKLEIIDGMDNGPLIINGDDSYLKKIKYNNIIKVGFNKKNNPKIVKCLSYFNRTEFTLLIDNEYVDFTFNVPGKHLLVDVALAIETGLLYNVKLADIQSAVVEFVPEIGRMNIINWDSNLVIDDCYNASYESIIGGFDIIKNEKKNKIIVLGDILELGKYSYKYHKKVIKKALKLKNKKILVIGKNYNKIKNKKLIKFENVSDILEFISKNNFHNSIFYIKGSRKNNLDKIVDYLKKTTYM